MSEDGKGDELPEGWASTPLKNCVDVLDNMRIPVNSDERQARQGPIPYYGATGQVGWIDSHIFDEEIILLGEDGAPFLDKSKPIAYIITGKSWVNNHAHVLRAIPTLASNQFVKYFLDSFDFAEHVNGTTRLKLTQGSMNAIPLALPPLAEQKRIVAKVETLLARVNAARQRLAKVPALLKRFRQSILAAACCGQLTEDWREQNPDEAGTADSLIRDQGIQMSVESDEMPELPETWRWVPLSHYAHCSRGRFLVRPRNDPSYFDGPYPFIQIGNLPREGGWITAHSQTLNEKGLKVSKMFPMGTIAIAIVGATIGNTGLLGYDMCFTDSMVGIETGSLEGNQYVEYFLRHRKQEIRESSYASGGQPNIKLEMLHPYPLALPPLAEQHEIVRRVEALLARADRIEKRLATATRRVETLTQAILAQAFRGELVPTEAELARLEGRDYEPASVLLESIRAARAGADTIKKSKKLRPAR